jgi:hypothetical protein
MSSCRTGIYFFIHKIFISSVFMSSQPSAVRFLDEKSKQKNQEKIIPAFTHNALRLAAIFSGPRALLFLNEVFYCFKIFQTTNNSEINFSYFLVYYKKKILLLSA